MQNDIAYVSTPTYLRSAVRGALRAMRALKGLSPRIGLVALLAIQAAACSDVTAPGRRMDREAVESVIPAITDARRRVASGIGDVSVRQQMTINLSSIEIALRADDVDGAEKGLAGVAAMMTTYAQRASADRPEVSAVLLVLSSVQKISSPGTGALLP